MGAPDYYGARVPWVGGVCWVVGGLRRVLYYHGWPINMPFIYFVKFLGKYALLLQAQTEQPPPTPPPH